MVKRKMTKTLHSKRSSNTKPH